MLRFGRRRSAEQDNPDAAAWPEEADEVEGVEQNGSEERQPSESDWNAVVTESEAGLPPVNWSEWAPPAPPPTEDSTEEAETEGAGTQWADWSPTATDTETTPGGEAEAATEEDGDPEPEPSAVATADSLEEPGGAGEPGDPAEPSDDLSLAVWETLAEPESVGNGSPAAATDTEAAAAAEADEAADTAAEVAEEEDDTPAIPVPEGVGLAGMPIPGRAPAVTAVVPEPETDEEEREYRTTLSWPPPRKPRVGAGLLSLLVMVIMVALLIGNGRIGRSSEKHKDAEARPALKTDPASVPQDWVVYRHPTGGFGISYPPAWTVRDDGTVVTVTDPATRAELRIEQRRPPGKTDPEDEWLTEERAFAARSPSYHRLQLSEASYQGHTAALWEYTFAEGNLGLHAADLEFVTKKDRFTLSFRGPINSWQGLLPTFQGFLSSFKAPK